MRIIVPGAHVKPLAEFAVLVGLTATGLNQVSNLHDAGPKMQAGSKHVAFEVTSVKPSNQSKDGIMGLYTYPDRVMCGFCTLEMLTTYAFDVQQFQVHGGPNWIRDTPYDVEGKGSESSQPGSLVDAPARHPQSPPTSEQREMLQSLLIDRFQLRFHRENKVSSVYLLLRGSGQLNLQPPKNTNAFPWVGSNGGGAIDGDGIAGRNISMTILCQRLSRYLHHPVVDDTNVKGNFDFNSEYSGEVPGHDIVPSILTSVRGLGLKLKIGKAPVDTIVVDGAEKPSEN
jgi:uncharacterized protein (TIGR03435 family)